ncbi:MAG: hypothetical protein LBQ59_05740 [Candidatus Peribacteria bacterium]|nr:hypothetical protein [Candidatus Peribacteria bacterium]
MSGETFEQVNLKKEALD